jgi:hydroxyethylthiazole kinase-like uncharacterized protein yjeF
MYILNNDQVRRVESHAFERGLPEAALMEKAGCAAAMKILEMKQLQMQMHSPVGILAGTGHNGADALIVARELHLAGVKVCVWCAPGEPKPLCEAHRRWFQHLGGSIVSPLETLNHCEIIVDGLLGFGTIKPPSGAIAHAINWCNQHAKTVISIDNPSGLCTNTGHIFDCAIRATKTLCIGVGKEGLFQDFSAEYCGEIETLDIGLSNAHVKSVLESEFSSSYRVKAITPQFVATKLPIRRKPDASKYSAGRALIVAGSHKYPGAALLASTSCRAAGAGYIVLDGPDDLRVPLLTRAPDIVFEKDACLDFSTSEASSRVRFDAILCGPGLDTQLQKLEACLNANTSALCLDADALNMIARSGQFPKTRAPTIITPHAAEFARLFPDLSNTHPKSAAAAIAAQRTNAIVVYKGPRTVISHPDGRVFVNTQSTPALAQAGSGDVLAGLIVGYAAQGMTAFDAAVVSVWQHSQTAFSEGGNQSLDCWLNKLSVGYPNPSFHAKLHTLRS